MYALRCVLLECGFVKGLSVCVEALLVTVPPQKAADLLSELHRLFFSGTVF
jgi:hypothetical protein